MNDETKTLKQLREEAGLTLEEFGAKIAYSKSTVQGYEDGDPSEKYLRTVSEKFKWPVQRIRIPVRDQMLLNESAGGASKNAAVKMLELERLELLAAIAWLVEREKDRDDLLLASRRSDLRVDAKNFIQAAVNAADEKEKQKVCKTN